MVERFNKIQNFTGGFGSENRATPSHILYYSSEDRSVRYRRRRRTPSSFFLSSLTIISVIAMVSAFQGRPFSLPAGILPFSKNNRLHSVMSSSQSSQTHRRRDPFLLRLHSSATETIQSDLPSLEAVDSRNATDADANGHAVNDSVAGHQDSIKVAVVNGSTPSLPASNGVTLNDTDCDVPKPTANGGYSHTEASKAKISAANKGKTPWNKGKHRSPEVRARIAAGVRARNRESFLQKLKDMGLTEEEHKARMKEERRRKDAERRARRTANGGYKPTEETKQKISQILKKKWANGEMSKRSVDPTKVRRGFTHSEETRAKISESLRKRWSQDAKYRENMLQKSHSSNADPSVKQKISHALKKKWQNPEFRAAMLEKMASRRKPAGPHAKSHREKISAALKAKWQDAEYRQKTVASIKRQRAQAVASRPPRPKAAPKPKAAKAAAPKSSARATRREKMDDVRVVLPARAKRKKKKQSAKKSVKKKANVAGMEGAAAVRAEPSRKKRAKAAKTSEEKEQKVSKGVEPDGSINRLREERRDLYELLYGDDSSATSLELGDENLESFDPYGLEDF